ncbi:MAG: arsenate reductase ArsC [Armatimonadota bacterium]
MPETPKPVRVLFLCTGNSARSQMAEGILRLLGGDRVEAFSAGTDPVDEVHPLAIATMAERRIDISHHRPKPLSEFEGQRFDLLISVCDGAREACPVYEGAERRLHWPLADPAAATGAEQHRLGAFRRAADELGQHIGELLRSL